MKMFDLSGKVALVTGGNGGIGLGMALGLAEAGAQIAVVGRNPDKLKAAVAEIEGIGAKATAYTCDLRDADACKALVPQVVTDMGRIDILVNNSGINYRKQPQDFTLEEWHDVMDTNLTAAFLLSQAVYPYFLEQGGGKIINVASIAAFMGSPVAVAYAPSKGGIVQLGKALAVAWAKDNIQINSVLPGWINTPLSVQSRKDIPGLEEMVIGRTPAGVWGQPADFAGAAVYLASAASNFVNGASLVIDGAYSSKA
ncbi:MAG: glucose 1-dehydrogenase [Rhodobacteraceae bacterium]|nr:glucose 1-dehydrogenase [Paracoccaceae bacterium]PHR53296.1 MAG: 2-deoxy-D-gluconate 3-dehydrogenase [Robiginitomaculum sp.]